MVWWKKYYCFGSLYSGKNNIIVDYLLRLFSDLIEWKLNENIFENICEVLFYFDIDFFVFRLNK